jgi:hypothetical protein
MSSSSYNPLHSIKLSSIVDSIPDWDKPEGAQTKTEGSTSDVGKNLKSIVGKSSAFFNPPSWLATTPTNDSKPLSQFPSEDDSNVSSTGVVSQKAVSKAPTWIDSTDASTLGSKQTVKSDIEKNINKPTIDVDLSDIPEEEQEKMRKYHLVLRGSYITISTLMFVAAAQSMILQFDIGLIFMALYTMLFSCMLCCFEIALTVSNSQRYRIVSFYHHDDSNPLIYILLYCTALFSLSRGYWQSTSGSCTLA